MRIILFFVSVSLISCSQKSSDTIEKGYTIRIIDGCEYIEFENSFNGMNNYSYSITHKGNCKNPIHYGNRKDSITAIMISPSDVKTGTYIYK